MISIIGFLLEVLFYIFLIPVFLILGAVILICVAIWSLWMCVELIIYMFKS